MKQTTFRQARVNGKNRSSHYYEGVIVEVVEVDEPPPRLINPENIKTAKTKNARKTATKIV